VKIIPASYKILTNQISLAYSLEDIERVARVCYKSEDKINAGSAYNLVSKLVASGHGAMLEHSQLSVKFIVDRGISHELVRHRLASFAQESTRYCNYSQDKFGKELTFIKPCFWEEDSLEYRLWTQGMKYAEDLYLALRSRDCSPQECRSVLPNSVKTELIVTANFREWRHIFKERCSMAAHPQMREVMLPLRKELAQLVPIIFDWRDKNEEDI